MLFCSTLLHAQKYSPLVMKPASCKGVSTDGTETVQVKPCCRVSGKLSGAPLAVESSANTSQVRVTTIEQHQRRRIRLAPNGRVGCQVKASTKTAGGSAGINSSPSIASWVVFMPLRPT